MGEREMDRKMQRWKAHRGPQGPQGYLLKGWFNIQAMQELNPSVLMFHSKSRKNFANILKYSCVLIIQTI